MDEMQLAALMARVDADEPNALYEYGCVLRGNGDINNSDKFIFLAAQLGHPYALSYIGEKYLAIGDRMNAEHYFKLGAKAGVLDCNVKLAVLRLKEYEQSSVKELEDLAEMGVMSACEALADYYHGRGNRKQAAYWRSLLK